jgi:murein DD-endopeptidase MepM/ murein hydrolase activator NlpD
MKFLIISLLVMLSQFSESHSKSKLEKKLNDLKKQTVEIHNNIISNNKELKIIKLDIDRNKQKQIIYLRYIKDKEVLGKRLFFLLQEKLYVSEISRLLKGMQSSSDYSVSKQIIRGFFFNQVKVGIDNYFQSFENLKVVNQDLENKLYSYKEKKKKLNTELKNLEKKILQVSLLQKKFIANPEAKKREKKVKKSAKNINELVKGVKVPKLNKKKNITTRFQMPLQASIVSEFGQNKTDKIFKNGVIFEVSEDSFVASPFDGIIVFANKFKSYGNLVIIENDNGYFCILAGMDNIIISSGNKVFKGEPIARVSKKLKNKLYFELRKNGKIINPKSKVEIL